ncbi:MAG: SDR family oxidoreductase [Pseudomonadales bacterium]|jgi:NAD(P)-dependent dehydrogenase (short-subunit alcohol dehydrogenase family)|nr:dehydrogenase [Gammaproteobacteria bacterium]MDP6028537.1 SDR family oxidoreductase [Arenicellales bacterium]MDP6265028.1 SDR family oxidoreductase [Pseudomonadales bacterium]|tara:strand:- start:6 stop:887 length:882 start_codon:yes stop_codon:yes gene_type:complete
MAAFSSQLTLQNKAAIITGASQGLGFEIAKQYVLAGASVMLCARDKDVLSAATKSLRLMASSESIVLSKVADVCESVEVDALVNSTIKRLGSIDILVNNAGVYGPKGPIDSILWDDWVQAININLLGSVLMCRAVVPHMKSKGYGKIVQLSGGGATNPMPNLSSYAVAKAGIVRFIETLALETAKHTIDVNAIAPGALNTRMLDEIIDSGPGKVGKEFHERALEQKASGGAGLEKGAKLAVFLGSAASDGISGRLISALWDPWQDLARHKEELADSDIYTLRRVVPADRGAPW